VLRGCSVLDNQRLALGELCTACRRGWRVSWRHITDGLRIVLALAGLIGLFVAPMGITSIDSTAAQYAVWVAWGFVVIFCVGIIGLTPYYGMREMRRGVERDLASEKERHAKELQTLRGEQAKVANQHSADLREYNQTIEDLRQQLQRIQSGDT